MSIEDWSSYFGELVGREPVFEHTEHTLESVHIDTTKMATIVPAATVPWREGMRRMVAHFHPEIALPA